MKTDARDDDFFLPDFCAARSVLAVVLVSQLLALILTFARPAPAGLLIELARVSLFVQWLALTATAMLCHTRARVARLPMPGAVAATLALLLLNTAALSVIAWALGAWLRAQGFAESLFPQTFWPFLLRNLGIAVIAASLLLRYFFVAQQWRVNVRAEARARLDALQARIRPHFLFNSMNTIASLTRRDPAGAEQAVEDLSDLLRATLNDRTGRWRLADELEVTQSYQRIEQLRLGERLNVDWQTEGLPGDALLPAFTVQPLLENAIHHGIEPLAAGGTAAVRGRLDRGDIELSVSNPIDASAARPPGHRLALDNIRQRLELAHGPHATLAISEEPGEYRVTIRFPYQR